MNSTNTETLLASLKFPLSWSEFEQQFGWGLEEALEIDDSLFCQTEDPDEQGWYTLDPKYKDCVIAHVCGVLSTKTRNRGVCASIILRATEDLISLKCYGLDDDEFEGNLSDLISCIGKEKAYEHWCSNKWEILELQVEDYSFDENENELTLVNMHKNCNKEA